MWDRIAAAVGHGAVPAASVVPLAPAGTDSSEPYEANGDGSRANGRPIGTADGPAANHPPAGHGARARRRGRLVTALAGLAAGLIIGIGGTAGVVQLTKAPATRIVAQIQLNPLPQFPQWQEASGTAVMRATASQQVIAVTLNAPERPGFYEVWLLARNGVSMISLGELNADHSGTFTIPPGTNLSNYSRIDVSLQPFNGITVHAKTSVVRGSLPAITQGAPTGTPGVAG